MSLAAVSQPRLRSHTPRPVHPSTTPGLEAADHELGRTKQTISDLFARLARRRRVALLPPSSLSQLLNSTTTGDPRPCRRCLIGTAAVLALIAAVLLYWKLRNAFGGGG